MMSSGQASEVKSAVYKSGDPAAGNTEQQTSTGLAYYRAQANVVVFTDGVEHWAFAGPLVPLRRRTPCHV